MVHQLHLAETSTFSTHFSSSKLEQTISLGSGLSFTLLVFEGMQTETLLLAFLYCDEAEALNRSPIS